MRDALLASGGWLEAETVASRTGLPIRRVRHALGTLRDTGMAETKPGPSRPKWRMLTDRIPLALAI